MSEKRKIIFREGLVIVPFLLLAAAVSLGFMFFSGRTVLDAVKLVARHVKTEIPADSSAYFDYDGVRYTISYFYGDTDSSVQYAEFTYDKNSDKAVQSLTLFEPRDGFDPGFYKIENFHSEEYVTYAVLENEEETELYLSQDVPVMYNLIQSYSWQGQSDIYKSAAQESAKYYKLLGIISLYTWDADGRENLIWGIGGNPIQFYSYITDSESEYKKISFY